MKRKFLEDMGLTKEQVDLIMSENGKDIETHKNDAQKYKDDLVKAQETLKSFDGVDVTALRGQITKLTEDLKNKDIQYQKEQDERNFNDLVKSMATEYKARDVKAVLPFLDSEKLMASKNQKDDIKAAFEEVKKNNDYLFLSDKPAPRVVSSTAGPDQNLDDKKTQANEAFRSLFGKE
jgi:hypothetical protein